MRRSLVIFMVFLFCGQVYSQVNPLDKLSFLLGEWEGKGEGFGGGNSDVHGSFHASASGFFIEVKNESKFEATKDHPEGEMHTDQGFISYDKQRGLIVYRQFNSEGYVNQYVLIDSLSTDSEIVFLSEKMENFESDAQAEIKILKKDSNQIETSFDLAFRDGKTLCMGKNVLHKTDITMKDDSAKVTGIGGIFFFSENPNDLRNWYEENLGLATTEYGSSFEFRNANRPEEINYLQWSPFAKSSTYFEPSKKEFMINYRVQNIEKLVEQLKAAGVTVVDEIETYSYGKFVHILDPEGNKLELWEPVDKVFTEMGGPTTK